jgi:hypothetical protein
MHSHHSNPQKYAILPASRTSIPSVTVGGPKERRSLAKIQRASKAALAKNQGLISDTAHWDRLRESPATFRNGPTFAKTYERKEVSARSQVEIGKELVPRISKPKVRRRRYYVELYPADLVRARKHCFFPDFQEIIFQVGLIAEDLMTHMQKYAPFTLLLLDSRQAVDPNVERREMRLYVRLYEAVRLD